jgi:carboxylesterase type B
MNENNVEHGEHCLYVNIWTKPQAGDAKKPVMVWIHGGAFMDGSGSIPAYNGGNIAEHEDVIAVSFK